VEGSTFSFELPVAPEEAPMIRLLLVDDHASSREPLAMLLDEEPDLTVDRPGRHAGSGHVSSSLVGSRSTSRSWISACPTGRGRT
jgi:hypothetical protein